MNTYAYLLFEDLIEKSSELGRAYFYKVNLDDDYIALDYALYLGDCFAADMTPDLNIGVLDENPSEMHYDNKTPKYFKSYSFSKFYADKIARLGAHLNSSITDSALDIDQIYDDLEEQAYIGFVMKDGASQPLFMNSFFKGSPKKGLFRRREAVESNWVEIVEELNGLMDYYKDLLARPKRKYISWLDEFVNFETDLSDDEQIEAVNHHEDNFYSFLGDEIDAVIDARPLPINIKAVCRKAYEICALDYLYNMISGNEELPEKYNNGEEEDWMSWVLDIIEGYNEAGDKACEHISATIRDFYSDIPEVVHALDIMFH